MRYINKIKLFILISFPLVFFSACSTKIVYDYGTYNKKNNLTYSTPSGIKNSDAMHRATMRPYTVFGVKYYPFVANIGDTFDGIASWYGPDFHAKKTSNGEIYNMYDMTAAHKTLPMNTVVRVDNIENGRSAIVRINDRGPFVAGRIIDLSNKAARQIDMIKKGTARVKLTVLGYNGLIANKNAPTSYYKEREENKEIKLIEDIVITTNLVSNIGNVLFESDKKTSKNINFAIQVGAFSLLSGAKKTVEEYKKRFPSKKVDYSFNGGIYRVYIRDFSSYELGQKFKEANNLINSIVIKN